jgi:hypothetical protein
MDLGNALGSTLTVPFTPEPPIVVEPEARHPIPYDAHPKEFGWDPEAIGDTDVKAFDQFILSRSPEPDSKGPPPSRAGRGATTSTVATADPTTILTR